MSQLSGFLRLLLLDPMSCRLPERNRRRPQFSRDPADPGPQRSTEFPDQPNRSGRKQASQNDLPEVTDEHDSADDADYDEPAIAAAGRAASPMNRDVFPFACVDVSNTHDTALSFGCCGCFSVHY